MIENLLGIRRLKPESFKELLNNTFSIFSNGLPKFIPACDAVSMRGGLSGGYHLKTIENKTK